MDMMGRGAGGFSLQDLMQAMSIMGGGAGRSNPSPMRVEPTMGTPPRNTTAQEQGTGAVERALAPGARAEPTASGETAHAAGLSAVDAEMDKAATEAWQNQMQTRKGQRAMASQQGRAAVKDATRPAAIRAMIDAMMHPGWSSPEEAAAYARWQGTNAVAGVTPPPGPEGWYPPEPSAARAAGLSAVDAAISDPTGRAGPLPFFPPGTFGPQSVVNPETESTTGYAPSSARAAHYGLDAVRRKLLDEEPE